MSGVFLLDTEPLLRWMAGKPTSKEVAAAIADPSSIVAVSAASI